MSEPRTSGGLRQGALTESAIQRALTRPMGNAERRQIIESAKLPNGSYDLDSLAVRAFDAHMDQQIANSKRKIGEDVKYAMYRDVVDPSDRYAVYRVTEDMRSGEPNDPMDRVRMEAINYSLTMALHPNTVQFTRELRFFKNLDDVKKFYNRRK